MQAITPFVRLLLVLCIGLGGSAAHAQADSPPIRFIVPIAPGSSGDTLTRLFAERFRAVTGTPTFVENRPGADLVLGTQNLLASPADGQSVLLVSNSTLLINPLFLKDLPYRSDELLPLAGLSRNPAVLVTAPNGRFKSLPELLEAARKEPGSVSIGVYGNTYRLGLLDLTRRAGVRVNPIPYKGATQAVTDVIGGSVDAALLDIGGATPLVTTGKVRALALAADKRQASLPDVPTVIEGGVPDYTLYVFIGLAIHAKTPPAIADRLEAQMQQVLALPDVREQFVRQSGGEFTGTDRNAFGAAIRAEGQRLDALVKSAGAEALNVRQP